MPTKIRPRSNPFRLPGTPSSTDGMVAKPAGRAITRGNILLSGDILLQERTSASARGNQSGGIPFWGQPPTNSPFPNLSLRLSHFDTKHFSLDKCKRKWYDTKAFFLRHGSFLPDNQFAITFYPSESGYCGPVRDSSNVMRYIAAPAIPLVKVLEHLRQSCQRIYGDNNTGTTENCTVQFSAVASANSLRNHTYSSSGNKNGVQYGVHYNDSYSPLEDVSMTRRGTIWTAPTNEVTYILARGLKISFGNNSRTSCYSGKPHILWNQAPVQSDPLYSDEAETFIPLQVDGVISYFDSCKPIKKDFANCEHHPDATVFLNLRIYVVLTITHDLYVLTWMQ
eukprot:jgi/Psemu1/11001/gm1.11001_g